MTLPLSEKQFNPVQKYKKPLRLRALFALARLLGYGAGSESRRFLENLPVFKTYKKVVASFDYAGQPFYYNLLRLSPSQLNMLFERIDTGDCYLLSKVRDKKRPVIVDLGTHIGVLPRVALARYPQARIVAVEPDKENFDLTVQNLATYPAEQITCLNEAVYPEQKEIDYYTSKKVDWRSTALDSEDFLKKESFSEGEFVSTYKVQGDTLDHLLAKLNLTQIDVFKMTIAGEMEHKVLETGVDILEKLKPAVIALYVYPKNIEAVTTIMKRLGYTEHESPYAKSNLRMYLPAV